MAKAKVLSSKVVFRGPLFSVTSEQVREPAGYTARRDIVRHRGSVVIMAINETHSSLQILLEKQYRPSTRRPARRWRRFMGAAGGQNRWRRERLGCR